MTVQRAPGAARTLAAASPASVAAGGGGAKDRFPTRAQVGDGGGRSESGEGALGALLGKNELGDMMAKWRRCILVLATEIMDGKPQSTEIKNIRTHLSLHPRPVVRPRPRPKFLPSRWRTRRLLEITFPPTPRARSAAFCSLLLPGDVVSHRDQVM